MMNKPMRNMEHTGYLGNSRVVLNHFDVSTQADIQHIALSYESEDEAMARLQSRSRRGDRTPHYSKQDIREQYCISDRGLGALESDRQSLFGCLSSHQSSPCSNRSSFLTACVRQKAPSDENLYELYKRHPSEYAPYPRRSRYPWAPLTPEIYRYDEDLKSSYFRRKACTDPSRYTWMPSDDESVRMEKPKSILDQHHHPNQMTPPPPMPPRQKHVSFARSHTLTSFDDAIVSLSSSSTHLNRMSRSQERLLDVRKTDTAPITRQPEPSDNIMLIDKIKRAPMKTQATQTEACLGRKPLPPGNINLSPRTMHRVKMVSQGAQTNGLILNGRKLMKSYSEAGSKYGKPNRQDFPNFEPILDHEPLTRTQSDEPPRSPFIVTSPPTLPDVLFEDPIIRDQHHETPQTIVIPSDTSSLSRSDHDSDDSDKKEIFIDFKPLVAPAQKGSKIVKRPLTKTMSDGEILVEQRKSQKTDDSVVPEKQVVSMSHENIILDEQPTRMFTPYFQKAPIRYEGICKKLDDPVYSSISESFEGSTTFHAQDSVDEEFHENLIYNRMYLSRQQSLLQQQESGMGMVDILHDSEVAIRVSPNDESIVPSVCLLPDRRLSPFASNDSLANDIRDHSDGIWNESQATVLQVDSGTENGTGLSSSELTSVTSPGSIILLTPSSRRKHLLMLQHQQRSSMDTETLDEEYSEQVQQLETSPRIVIEKPSKTDSTLSSISVPSSSKQYLTTHTTHTQQKQQQQQRVISPTWRRRSHQHQMDSPSESPLPAVVPDLLLARTDSCKTNTDVSESTTTDDYITANSGTDSSRKSGSIYGVDLYNLHSAMQDGSSFESSKGDLLGDDMVVPSYSPTLVHHGHHRRDIPDDEEHISESHRVGSSLSNTPVPDYHPTHHHHHHHHHKQQRSSGRSTPSESSSSCGSYSVDGSCPDLLDRSSIVPSSSVTTTTTTTTVTKGSEDERSVHYSSSGYYESPLEDDLTWKSPKHGEDLKHSRRRPYTLDISSKPQPETYTLSPNGGKYKTGTLKREPKISPSKEHLKTGEKQKRVKSRTRSPMQTHKKNHQMKKSSSSFMPHPDERYKPSVEEGKITSDESSCDFAMGKYAPSQTSPRKNKKNKENNRRKSLPRSPTSQRAARRASEEKPSSLPGSLSRRKSAKHHKSNLQPDDSKSSNTLGPYSPGGSPSLKRHSPKTSPDSTKLKALSAESLRSVSPGSDSVFYSDPSSHTAEHQVHCLHCGKEVDIVTTDDPDKSISSNGQIQDIVQPPAGFEDSPILKYPSTRLYKKMERRIRSEERSQAEHRRYRYKPDVRAKSEERGAKTYRGKLRPMAKSATASQEGLKSTDSSPSVLPGAPEGDDDQGVYDVPYIDGCWMYIDERDEVQTSTKISPSDISADVSRRGSVSSTESEQEFRKRYQSVTHRMVHRKSCLEMYKRQTSKSFANGISEPPNEGECNHLKQKLEEILKLMLVIWCRQNQAINVISQKNECDKTVIVHRESGEFGFRIHGSKPVVVSAIEPGTPAETSGLEVGDIVLAVNGVSVLDKSHSEVVKIAHAGSDTLNLEVARTCYAITPTEEDQSTSPALYSGYLWKLSGYASGVTSNKWIRRWFCLKQNNCLYYYKTDSEKQPVGVVMLFEHEVQKIPDDEGGMVKPYRFVIKRPDSVPLHLAADTSNAEVRWIDVITRAINDSRIVDEFLEETKRNMIISPSAINKPDCFGYLVKLGTQWKSWSRRYCVLKDACLYFYQDASAKSAFGVAYLHGYRVQQSTPGNKKHAFEIIPPDSTKKHYYFHTESDTDRKRWIAALEYSIDKWFKVQ